MITYNSDKKITVEQFKQVLNQSTLGERRPIDDEPRLQTMLDHAGILITAWDGERLVGLGNAISDGYLVVYYPHLVVHPEYQGNGIGTEIVKSLQRKYHDFHQQSIIADGKAIEFYKKSGFVEAGSCQ